MPSPGQSPSDTRARSTDGAGVTLKPGTRALGVAESYTGTAGATSTLAGVVTRADRTTDGFAFADCTVGGLDATDAILDIYDRLDREDVRFVLVAGVAPAWYNLLDLHALHARLDRPVLAVTFEASSGLEDALQEEFSGDALDERRQRYDRLPAREAVAVNDQTVHVRAVGLQADDAAAVVRRFTPEGGRPEPLRVARLAARAADEWRGAGSE